MSDYGRTVREIKHTARGNAGAHHTKVEEVLFGKDSGSSDACGADDASGWVTTWCGERDNGLTQWSGVVR